ncbi:MAG: hypothetical protein Q4C48_08830 [Lachnospiraceae bacterium]|nr:hypothetical protein [Lachnospiraceae bacterium]
MTEQDAAHALNTKMARELGVISAAEFMDLNSMLVRNGLNNPAAKLE